MLRKLALLALTATLTVVGAAATPADAAGTDAPGAPVVSRLTAIGALVSWTPSSLPDTRLYILLTLVDGAWTAVGVSGFPPDTLTSMNVKLQPATTYTYAVFAEDSNGHRSAQSPSTTFTTPARDVALTCHVAFNAITSPGWFLATVQLVNTSSFIVTNGWTLTFRFPGDQQVTAGTAFNGTVTQSGADVTITNSPWNPRLDAYGQIGTGFRGTDGGTFVTPGAFSVNGVACG